MISPLVVKHRSMFQHSIYDTTEENTFLWRRYYASSSVVVKDIFLRERNWTAAIKNICGVLPPMISPSDHWSEILQATPLTWRDAMNYVTHKIPHFSFFWKCLTSIWNSLDQTLHGIRHELTQLFYKLHQRLAVKQLFGIWCRFYTFLGNFLKILLRPLVRPSHQHHVRIKIMLL